MQITAFLGVILAEECYILLSDGEITIFFLKLDFS